MGEIGDVEDDDECPLGSSAESRVARLSKAATKQG
jgi:hypothetical protein